MLHTRAKQKKVIKVRCDNFYGEYEYEWMFLIIDRDVVCVYGGT